MEKDIFIFHLYLSTCSVRGKVEDWHCSSDDKTQTLNKIFKKKKYK